MTRGTTCAHARAAIARASQRAAKNARRPSTSPKASSSLSRARRATTTRATSASALADVLRQLDVDGLYGAAATGASELMRTLETLAGDAAARASATTGDVAIEDLTRALGIEKDTITVEVYQALALGFAGALAMVNSGEEEARAGPASGDVLPTTYDVEKIRAYWSKRPLAIAKRSLSLLLDVAGWVSALLVDIQTKSVEKNSVERAGQLKDIIAKQGPAFVKVGQAVAIRPDLLPPAYLAELQTLLDGVKAFSNDEAKALIREQLGKPLDDIFEDVSAFDKPVAAASIGQVYRAQLKRTKMMEAEQDTWGAEVAVKVQRPQILDVVTLDLLVIRTVLQYLAKLPKDGPLGQIQQGAEGFLPVLDVAAERFLEELDFGMEASNASRFEADMNSVAFVRGSIKVPHVYRSVSTRKVLTQEWVTGRKLTEIDENTSKETREKLVETLLNAYMVQFLESGFLHADPHPGNFLLQDDGKLCILDYGMMTTISEEQRIAFVEYIAHLSAKEYDKTLADLVNLGFVPPELADDPINRSIVVPVLAETLETLYGSGGGITTKTDALNAQQSSRVGELSDKLEALGKEYPLQLPPYFVLILRAFGTLEGLGLSVDSNYAIVDECFPYIARRLLSDDSPRMRDALRSFVYGGSDRLRVSRVKDIAGGFSRFTNSMGATEAVATTDPTRLDPATKDALAIIFNEKGNYLQDLVVEEAVRAADAVSRSGAATAWQVLGQAWPLAAAASVTPLALIPGLNGAIVLSALASQNKQAISLTFEDKKNLALLRSIVELISPEGWSQSLTRAVSSSREVSSQIEPESIRSIGTAVAPGLRRMSSNFGEKLGQRLTDRSRQDFEKSFPRPVSR
ncbi:Importin-beta, N-terminal domain [Ostreococcus tauri]|uniref:Importin-beta, N-terminal domain n=1 Tax=Ostreococcus tauri TaxID=70448 RepID=A0A090M2K7_OSTTA|nr:Importin-beta, N-terminal domain [Ostreococcus tauri]CEF98426.1 Importin-beta, N-terminal domain [Ostreococcus tauri]|eukprot:XP_022839256.1 Importin-beta, N-terminal domain [Ostreococcus tauri]